MKTIKATSAIVAIAPLALLSAALSLSNAHAQEPGKALVMSIYLDTVGGNSVLAGDYRV